MQTELSSRTLHGASYGWVFRLAVGRASFVIRRRKKVRERPGPGARRGPAIPVAGQGSRGPGGFGHSVRNAPPACLQADGTAESRRLKSALRADARQTGG